MKNKIRIPLEVVILFCIALLMSNCQHEENSADLLQSKIQTVSIDEAKNFLLQSKNNSLAKSTNNELDNLEFDKTRQEKINNSDQLLTVIPFRTNNDFENNRILILKIDNKIKSIVFSMFHDEDSAKGSFSGKIFSYTLDGDFITGFRAEDGIIVSHFIENKTISSDKRNDKTSTLTSRSAGGLREVIVQNNYRKTVHALDMFGSTGGMYGDGLFGGGIGNSGGGGYSWDAGGSISAPTPMEIATALEKQINSDRLSPCPKEVLEMLKNATNADIAKMFSKLGASTTYNVTFYSETTIDGTPASTQRVSQYNYKIQLSTDYTGATKLFRAGNILHELGHAYFMSIKDDYSSTTPPNVNVFNNYPALFQGYVEKKYPNMYDAHHIEMANQYIDVIAQTLQEYNKSADPSGSIPYQVYTDIAWGGLKGTPIFEEKFKVGTTERLRIDNRYAAEQTGNAVGYSTGQLQNTVGKPCN